MARKSPDGVATNDLVFSSQVGTNAEMFPDILALYVEHGASIADVTYGKGVFWKNVDTSMYDLHATDITTGVDCRSLPYVDGSMDCVVLDPPTCTRQEAPHIRLIRTLRTTIRTTQPAATRSITMQCWTCISPRPEKRAGFYGPRAFSLSNVKMRCVPTVNG